MQAYRKTFQVVAGFARWRHERLVSSLIQYHLSKTLVLTCNKDTRLITSLIIKPFEHSENHPCPRRNDFVELLSGQAGMQSVLSLTRTLHSAVHWSLL